MVEQIITQFWYIGLFPLVVIEWPMITILSGYLIHTGYFHLFPTFFIVLLGDMTSDIIYYHVGFFAHKSEWIKKYIAKKKFLFENLAVLETLWEKHPFQTMFFGKQAYMLCGPIVISSGVIRVGIVRFMTYSTPVSAFQAALMIWIGYYLGHGYIIAGQYMKYPAILMALVMVWLFFVYKRIRVYASQSFRQ